MNWEALQQEHAEWVNREYPGQDPGIPAAGLVEESGELLHAVLKTLQRQVWGEEPRYPVAELQQKLRDAIGDCAIYVCSFCNAADWRLADIAEMYTSHSTDNSTLQQASALVGKAVEFMQVHNRADLGRYFVMLRRLASELEVPFHTAIQETWSEVKQRTRKKARRKIVCLCGSTRFLREFQEQGLRETLAGNIVLSIGAACSRDDDDKTFGGYMPADDYDEVKLALDALHMDKIAMADEVLILNQKMCSCGRPELVTSDEPNKTVCCGEVAKPYIGDSTRRELAYARSLGKKVRFLWPES